MPMLPKQLRRPQHKSASPPPPVRRRAVSIAGALCRNAPTAATARQSAAGAARAPAARERDGSASEWSVAGRPSSEGGAEGSHAGSVTTAVSHDAPAVGAARLDVFERLAAEADRRKVRLVDLFRQVRCQTLITQVGPDGDGHAECRRNDLTRHTYPAAVTQDVVSSWAVRRWRRLIRTAAAG